MAAEGDRSRPDRPNAAGIALAIENLKNAQEPNSPAYNKMAYLEQHATQTLRSLGLIRPDQVKWTGKTRRA